MWSWNHVINILVALNRKNVPNPVLNITVLKSYILFKKGNRELGSAMSTSGWRWLKECWESTRSQGSNSLEVTHALMMSHLFACLEDISPKHTTSVRETQANRSLPSLLLAQSQGCRKIQRKRRYICGKCDVLCFEIYQRGTYIKYWLLYTFLLHLD